MAAPTPIVLFLATSGRSGSTLLERTVGQWDGWCSVGELSWVWEKGLIEDQRCGCGTPLRSCPFWTEVFERGFGGFDGVDAEAQAAGWEDERLTRNLGVFGPARIRERALATKASRLDVLITLYRSIAATAAADVVVDSSKFPLRPAMVLARPDLSARVVHLVRDPRGMVFSWRRAKPEAAADAGEGLAPASTWHAAAWWLATHVALDRSLRGAGERVMQLRYEDFVADPGAALGSIAGLVGSDADPADIVEGRALRLGPTHTVWGNPDRHRSGLVEVRSDERWRAEMPASEKRLVTAITGPMLRRYGYPLHTA
ncbi:MAG: sulfotransferase [Actinobacteria bacterium]|nr:sulfotransferase [Actinomycetota bacterium]